MDYVIISDWLKNTIPGIIILGALGSLIAGFVIWFAIKLFKLISYLNRFVIVRVFGENLSKIGVFYARSYYTLRATAFQLFNKQKELPLIILHQNLLANRNISIINVLIFLLTTYFMFLLFDTSYPKTTALFVCLFILSLHDAILFTIWSNKIGEYFYGHEASIAKNTYESRDMVVTQSLVSLLDIAKKKKSGSYKDS